jgi:UDP-N-acetylglucosamine 2-epimerase (non-hydrolysing)
MATVLTVLGTRPEIIKLSPLIPLLRERFTHVLVHSGQHYSYELDARFFAELELPPPDHMLNVGSASHGEQSARMLSRLEPILMQVRPDVVVVQGDTNTTLAGALAAAKMQIPVVHVEAGCRSFNRAMPEELNRVVVDHLATLLCAPDAASVNHLRAEGIAGERVALVGSTAVDACERARPLAVRSTVLERLGLAPGGYLALTLHRAENTTPEILPGILAALAELAAAEPIVFPVHPRTAAALQAQGLALPAGVVRCEPLGYLDTLRLVSGARALLTDSGGLQEEAAVLGTPALILRRETEWQGLLDAGIHTLVGNTPETILAGAAGALAPEALTQARQRPTGLRTGASQAVCDLVGELVAATRGEQALAV